MPTSTNQRSYRAYYAPTDSNGVPFLAETGVLPFVQVQARGAEEAQRAAHHLVNRPIAAIERVE